jgi:hypothetical protein
MSTPIDATPCEEDPPKAPRFIRLDMDDYRARLDERKIKRRQDEETAKQEAWRNSQMKQLPFLLDVLHRSFDAINRNIKCLEVASVVGDLDILQNKLNVLVEDTNKFSKCSKQDDDFVFLAQAIVFRRVVDDLLELVNQIDDIADTAQDNEIGQAIALSARDIHESLTQVATILAQQSKNYC